MKMINKLYDGLTAQEKAALSFHHIITGNSAEADKIDATVGQYLYRLTDGAYRRRLYCYMAFESLVSMEYWKLLARLNICLAGFLAAERMGESEEYTEVIAEKFAKIEGYMLALDDALATICTEHGMDVDAIRRFASMEPHAQMLPESVLDTERRDGYLATWRDLLTA